MNTKQLLSRRAATVQEMRDMEAEAIAADPSGIGVMTAEQAEKYDRLKAALADLDAVLVRTAHLDDAERRTAATPIGTGDRHLDQLAAQVGILDVIRAQLPGVTDAGAGRAREVSAELARRSGRAPQGLLWNMRTPSVEQRTLTSGMQGTTPNGAALIPTVLRSDLFIDRLRAATVVRALGARVLTDLVGNVDVPRRTRSVTGHWVSENTPIPFSDQAFDKVQLRPKHCGSLTELSRNMVMQGSPDVEALTRDDMAAVMANALDAGALFGTGTGAEPTGILSTVGVASIEGGARLWPDVLAAVAGVQGANVTLDAPGFVATPDFVRRAAQEEKVAGSYAGLVLDQPGTLAGYPLSVTTALPTTARLIFGNWSDLLIGLWSELDILVNPFAEGAYAKGNILVRAFMTVDVATRHPESFAVVTAPATP